LSEILNRPDFKIKIYDPYHIEKIKIEDKEYSLAANFSAPYGLWLAENNLGSAAYLTLLDRNQRLTMPHLYMLEPYNPNKKVIVLIHGLASSPEAWIAVTNEIMGDKSLREHYQVWQVFYSNQYAHSGKSLSDFCSTETNVCLSQSPRPCISKCCFDWS
jgi:pimeloyl-ACP methyl ester carboxylesterase